MSGFNGSGVYVRPFSWVNDKANGINITASRFDTDGNTVATALSTCICKDGQQTTTARIPFAVGLSVSQGTVGAPSICVISDTGTGFYQTSAGKLSFASNGVNAFNLTSTGINNTAIGATTTSTGAFTNITASGTVNKVTITAPAASATLTIANTKTLTASNTLTLAGTDATTITFQGTDTYVGRATTDTLTNKTFDTAGTGNVFKINGTTISANTGTGSNVLATSPTLVTPNIGTATGAKLTLSPSGSNNGLVVTAASGQDCVDLSFSGSVANSISSRDTDATSGGQTHFYFLRNASIVGSISATNAATAYNTSSDARLKTIQSDLGGSGAIMDALRPVNFTWKYLNDQPDFGFIAQDVAHIVPSAVLEGDDDPNKTPSDEGFKQWQGDWSKLIPYIVAEIKSLRARVAALEGK